MIIDAHSHPVTMDCERYPLADPNASYRPAADGSMGLLKQEMDAVGVDKAFTISAGFYGWDNSYAMDELKGREDWLAVGVLVDPASAAGPDDLEQLVAAGAGGHTGNMTGFAFVPAVREFFDGTIVLGGGIGDGRAIKAAEVLGADLAYIGTRFIATNESLAHTDYRQMLVDSTIEDLILTNAVTGVHANWLRQSLISAGMDPDALETDPDVDFTDPQSGVKRWANTWSAGHGVGVIDQIESVQSLVSRLGQEYQSA